MPKNKLDETVLAQYKHHPRVLELRCAMIFNVLSKEYGQTKAIAFVEAICDAYYMKKDHVKYVMMSSLIITSRRITNVSRYRQELVFMGAMWGETKADVFRKYLFRRDATGYAYDYLRNYVTDEWLSSLDKEVQVIKDDEIRADAKKFLETFENFITMFK